MPRTEAIRPRAYLLLLLPVFVAAAAIAAELTMKSSGGVSRVFDERIKKTIEMNSDLAKWFIGLATTLIGAAAYYVRVRSNELAPPTRFSRVAIVLTLIGAVSSIFFGHLWLANMRDMVSNDYFDAKSTALIWPERLQYISFLASLCWFGLLTVERESSEAAQAALAAGGASNAAT